VITRSIRFRMALWYAALLAGALALFGASTYVGLERYLQRSLEESLSKQARSIGDVLLVNIKQSGEDYVDNEITEHYSPEINGRFIRVTRADGRRIYVSGSPKDGTFDPALVAAPRLPVVQEFTEFTREVERSDGHELLLHGLPYRASDGTQFIIEVAAPYNQIESVLRGDVCTGITTDRRAGDRRRIPTDARCVASGGRDSTEGGRDHITQSQRTAPGPPHGR